MSILECFGQDHAIIRLQKARQMSRLSHSYIFYGPGGVGKGLLAGQWAKLMLCSDPQRRKLAGEDSGQADSDGLFNSTDSTNSADSTDSANTVESDSVMIDDCCDKCADCLMVRAGTHPDLHKIDKQSVLYTRKARSSQMLALPIDVIREMVIEPAGVFPSRKRARIFIIEQAESMNIAAQNALLKTLEEPPANTFLILVTSNPELFLPTIRSRCQEVRFVSLPKAFIYKRLLDCGVEERQGRFWAEFSDGRLGYALQLAQMGLYDTKREFLEQLGRLSYDNALVLAEWLQSQAKEFGKVLGGKQSEISTSDADRQGRLFWLDIIVHVFSQVTRRQVFGPSGQLSEPGSQNQLDQPDQAEQLDQIGRRFDPYVCSRVIKAVTVSRRYIFANVNPALIFESLMLECLNCASAGV